MSSLLLFLKHNSRLASPSFMLAVIGAGVAMLFWRRTWRVGRAWLATALVGFWLIATPTGAWLVSLPLAGATPPRLTSRDQARGAQAVVVLGGGIISYVDADLALDDLNDSAPRVIEGARVYRLLGDPLVVVSGGNTERLDPPRTEAAAFRDAMIRLGVPVARILVEDQALTTREEALRLKPMLASRQIDRIVLVTSATHMGRSLATFRAVGIDVLPSSALPAAREGHGSLWPNHDSLVISDNALYDYVAWLYYRLRGWT
jgi:uncharacterized SAM-binding protein YcdF (DUF218 family)